MCVCLFNFQSVTRGHLVRVKAVYTRCRNEPVVSLDLSFLFRRVPEWRHEVVYKLVVSCLWVSLSHLWTCGPREHRGCWIHDFLSVSLGKRVRLFVPSVSYFVWVYECFSHAQARIFVWKLSHKPADFFGLLEAVSAGTLARLPSWGPQPGAWGIFPSPAGGRWQLSLPPFFLTGTSLYYVTVCLLLVFQ